MATVTVSTAAELSAALSSAQAGDTILLNAGDYGDLKISNLSFASAITIESADPSHPAVFKTVSISGSQGIAIDNVEVHFVPTATTLSSDSAVRIYNSSNVSITHSDIVGGPAVNGVDPSATTLDSTGNVLGYPCARGISVLNSTNVQLSSNDIYAFHKGIVMSNVTGLSITANEIHDLRGTPISGADASSTVISGNYLHDINPWHWGTGDHADFIHIWTDPNLQTTATTGLVITGNYLAQGSGTAVLGIYLDDNTNQLGFTNTQVSNNVIYNGNAQGIRLENVTNSSVDSNVLLQSSGELKIGPGINLAGSTDGLLITHNVISGLDLGHLTGDSRGNVLVQSVDASLPNFSGNLEGDALTWLEAMQIRQHLTNDAYSTDPAPWLNAGISTGGTPTTDPVPPPTLPPSGDPVPDVTITGTNLADKLSASGNGLVWVKGLDGGDTIIGGTGNHWLFGGLGDDKYIVSDSATKVIEMLGEGTDTVRASVDCTLPDNVENLVLVTGAHVGTGNGLDNVMTGNNDGNSLYGLGGNDIFNGGSGDDFISGGEGNDQLIGGAGNDVLYGGAGNDTFIYGSSDLSTKRASFVDTIMDFASGDKIDLSSIDASTSGKGNNEFSFIGTAAFSGVAGQLNYYTDGAHTYVCGDRNGDKVADFTICLDGLHNLGSGDFIL